MQDFWYSEVPWRQPSVPDMSIDTTDLNRLQVKTAADIPASGDPATALDRYLLDSTETNGLVALVEHTLAPGVLAAPVHRHTREDEYSLVLEGRLGVFQDDEEAYAEPGELVLKPRGHWHTFWNAGRGRLRILEVIAPGGLEMLFRRLGEPGGEYDPETLPALAAQYGAQVDFSRTMPLVQRHGLQF
jgi:mannose-6-phosphate isomerase-like protein (cupin superfamily)